MKVLVAAKRLAADRTSEGICSSKYVGALIAAGHEVHCITGETMAATQAEWHRTHAPLHGLGAAPPSTWVQLIGAWSTGGSVGAFSARKFNGAVARLTGYGLVAWSEVAQWREAIRAVSADWRPDVIVIRGAGREFEPHIAMLGWRANAPWVAHYHDPYPASFYPEPYRQHVPLQSARQERVHRHIIAAADALTFPSQRLLTWVLRDDLQGARRKAFVVPHIAGGLMLHSDEPVDELTLSAGQFNLVHTGTLLRERDPRPLLNAVRQFIGDSASRREQFRLVFVGRVDASHLASPEWQALTEQGVLQCVNARVSYRTAVAAAAAADCVLILEPDSDESPFFPAKLADSLAIQRPILAITPDRSVTTDILGRDYALRVRAGDRERLAEAVARLWFAWQRHELSTLLPAAASAPLSEAAVGHATAAVFDHIRDARKGRAA